LMFLTTLPLFIFMKKNTVGFQNRLCLDITNIIKYEERRKLYRDK